jgi:hypothetical protein
MYKLLLILFFSSFAHAEQKGFGHIAGNGRWYLTSQDVRVLRSKAVNTIDRAIEFHESETVPELARRYNSVYKRMRNALRSAPIFAPNESPDSRFSESKHCNTGVAMYVTFFSQGNRIWNDGIIHICRRPLQGLSFFPRAEALESLTFMLIHEAFHRTHNSQDECSAEGWTSAIYMYANKSLPPKHAWRAYSSRCGNTYSHREIRLDQLLTYLEDSLTDRVERPWGSAPGRGGED